MTTIDRLHAALTTLQLTALPPVVDAWLARAGRDTPAYGDFLVDLLGVELAARRERYLRTRLQLAHLPFHKTLADFDFAFQPSADPRTVQELATLRFVHEASNVLLLGPPGVGKTHLAVALAIATIEAGQSAYFITAPALVADLGQAARENRLPQRLGIYTRPKVLIIDEMGYLPLDELGATLLFHLVSARYERGSIILTSNKSYGDWGSIFRDPVLATAVLDRLLHHATTLTIRGNSYRLKDRGKAGFPPPLSPPPPLAAAPSPGA